MKFALGAWFALVLSGVGGSTAQAFCFLPCPPPCCIVYQWQPVTCYRSEWREEKVPCVVQRVSYRTEVTPVKVHCWVPKVFDEQVRTSYYVPVPREVEREVWRCVMVPTVRVDPWSCCCYTTLCPQWVSQRVRCVEYDYRKEERDARVQVCRWVQHESVVEQVRYVPVVTQEQSWTVRRYCVMVPYQAMVCVPAYVCP